MEGKMKRLIDCAELSDRLRNIEKFREIPTLKHSHHRPEYVETRENGTEVYQHEGRTLTVGIGEVIDLHGNVVNLGLLGSQGPVNYFRSILDIKKVQSELDATFFRNLIEKKELNTPIYT